MKVFAISWENSLLEFLHDSIAPVCLRKFDNFEKI